MHFKGLGENKAFLLLCWMKTVQELLFQVSIHGREDARIYAKAIMNGQSAYNLSVEEKKVISKALNKNL